MLKRRRNQAPPLDDGTHCPVSECMQLLGGSWTPYIIWHLSAGPRRFSELENDIPPISAKVLSTRLKALRTKGVIIRTVQPTSPPSVEYTLSALGHELLPVIQAIVDVGTRLKRSANACRG
ncbi:helix-turn-helix domain-containing protein [uncultured Maricaulis sp.]|mgnify:CR=1 FL=1|uniref:winged helix-turn-helix transcriptional regulator n=1 Tax=uncultured Maricaulis sp. TaxID=174710 RepID=UPI00263806DB|nr:helix-turn-helix domain-containing protein [uncultured Maricaulis sp.]